MSNEDVHLKSLLDDLSGFHKNLNTQYSQFLSEYQNHNSASSENVQRLKKIVDKLFEQASTLKDNFYSNILNNADSLENNDTIASDEPASELEAPMIEPKTENEEVGDEKQDEDETKMPLIKVIDINKLKYAEPTIADTSIISLSSDEDTPKKVKTAPRTAPTSIKSSLKSTSRKDSAAKKRVSFHDHERKSKKSIPVPSTIEVDESSPSDDEVLKKSDGSNSQSKSERVLDEKFNMTVEVTLERYPCEEALLRYRKNLESVTEMKTSKRSRSSKDDSPSSSDIGGDPKKGRTKPKDRPNRKKKCREYSDSLNNKDEMVKSNHETSIDTAALDESDSEKQNNIEEDAATVPSNIESTPTENGNDALTENQSDSDEMIDEKIKIKEKDAESEDEPLNNLQPSNTVVKSDPDDNASTGEDDDQQLVVTKKLVKLKGKKKKLARKVAISDSDSDNDRTGDKKDFEPAKESSSSSNNSSDEKISEDEDFKTPEKKKPRRIKRTRDSSSDEEKKASRKQLRKVIDRDSLSETTKKAEAEEQERKKRLLDKQKKYNQNFEKKDLNAVVDKVILDYDEGTNEAVLEVDKRIVKKLKPHQASGIKFMWDACFESCERAKTTKGSGCILAHCMGLGKTLQVIALAHTLLVHNEETGVKRILVVCPINTVLNWKSEFKQWLPDDEDFEVFELVSCKQNYEKQFQVNEWFRCGGVLIIGYTMFRNLSNPANKRLSKKMRTAFHNGLVDPGPDLVVCDEGHLLKNEKTHLNIAMNRLRSIRRIVLTGTPLQNNLKEYWCMVQFIKPNLLGTYKEYLNRFVNPITNGQYTDSTPHDIQIMRRRSHVLHKMLDGVVQRRDYAVLAPYLPPKYEYVLFVNLSETQVKIYQHYMDHYARRSGDTNRTSFLFTDFQQLQRIGTHPRVLLDKAVEDRNKFVDDEEDSEGSLKDFVVDGSTSEETSDDESAQENESSGDEKKSKKKNRRVTRASKKNNSGSDSEVEEVVAEKTWWQEYCDGPELDNFQHSGKLSLLFEILKECEQIGDKLLVFSQSLYTLNCIEYFLAKIDDETHSGATDGHNGSWSIGSDYFRLDGSTTCDNRAAYCDKFNCSKNPRARLFLISTKAGGLGINLVAANRVIIFDVSWNPSHDIQSIYRVYRFGQNKPSYIYRLVSYGTMEMKIYERQVTKQAISKRVIDEQQIDRHYNQNDLMELYKCDLEPTDRPIPLVPRDVLLGELLQNHAASIYKYHEHQSLLENKEEETLNEDERKAAWEEFESEKVNRQKYMGMAGNNHQMAAHLNMALMNLVRRDNPTWSEVQIKGIIPALAQQMQMQIMEGNNNLYNRVNAEISMILQAQAAAHKMQERDRMLRLIKQQQEQQTSLGNMNVDVMELMNQQMLRQQLAQNHMPQNMGGSGTQRGRPRNQSSTSEIIDLVD